MYNAIGMSENILNHSIGVASIKQSTVSPTVNESNLTSEPFKNASFSGVLSFGRVKSEAKTGSKQPKKS